MMKSNADYEAPLSLTDEIADVVRERILKGEYEIGEKIKENKIAYELRVSRTPIRDAFKALESEGLIDYIPNRGCFAKGFTKQDVSDIYTVREALEEIAVKWAVERIEDEELRALEEQIFLMEHYTTKQDIEKIMEINTVFHDLIYTAARSRFLAQVLRSYKDYLDKTKKSLYYKYEFLESILEEHKAIFHAIKEHNSEEAVEAVDIHLRRSMERTETVWNLK